MKNLDNDALEQWIARWNKLSYLDIEHAITPVIEWAAPTPVDYVPGGFKLDGGILNAKVRPAECALEYDPPAGTLLPAGTHTLLVLPENPVVYTAKPLTVTLTVNKAKAALQTRPLPEVDYQEGGYPLSGNYVESFFTLAGPGAGLELAFTCNGETLQGEKHLPAGTYTICALLTQTAESANFVLEGTTCLTLTVKKAKLAIQLAQPQEATYAPGGYELSEKDFGISEHPSEVAFEYQPALGTKLRAGPVDLCVSLKKTPASDNYELEEVKPVTLNVAKAKLALKLDTPENPLYVPGGVLVSKDMFKLPGCPDELKLTYKPEPGTKLLVGAEILQVDFAPDPVHDNYELTPIPIATFKVAQANATITWAAPKPGVYQPGGFILTAEQLCATVDVDELKTLVIYKLGKKLIKSGDALTAGTYQVTATLPDDQGDLGWNYKFVPATCTIVVEKLKFKIGWGTLKPVETTGGVFKLTEQQLCAKPDKYPDDIRLAYNFDLGAELLPNTQPGITLEVGPAEPDKYEADSVTTNLYVRLSDVDKIVQSKKQRDEETPNKDWTAAAFDPKDPRTWIPKKAVRYDSAGCRQYCESLTNSDDKATIKKIADCAHGGREGALATGMRLHAHTKSGTGGLSFAYDHVGGASGKEVEGVIYDYTDDRQGNKYNWTTGGKCGGAALWYKPVRQIT